MSVANPLLASDLALRAASTLEHLMGDLEAAEVQYKLVEAHAPGYVEAQFSLARVAGKLGHADEERAVLMYPLPGSAPARTCDPYRVMDEVVHRSRLCERTTLELTFFTLAESSVIRWTIRYVPAMRSDPSARRPVHV